MFLMVNRSRLMSNDHLYLLTTGYFSRPGMITKMVKYIWQKASFNVVLLYFSFPEGRFVMDLKVQHSFPRRAQTLPGVVCHSQASSPGSSGGSVVYPTGTEVPRVEAFGNRKIAEYLLPVWTNFDTLSLQIEPLPSYPHQGPAITQRLPPETRLSALCSGYSLGDRKIIYFSTGRWAGASHSAHEAPITVLHWGSWTWKRMVLFAVLSCLTKADWSMSRHAHMSSSIDHIPVRNAYLYDISSRKTGYWPIWMPIRKQMKLIFELMTSFYGTWVLNKQTIIISQPDWRYCLP